MQQGLKICGAQTVMMLSRGDAGIMFLKAGLEVTPFTVVKVMTEYMQMNSMIGFGQHLYIPGTMIQAINMIMINFMVVMGMMY